MDVWDSTTPLKFVANRDAGERDESVFEEEVQGKSEAPRFIFKRYKNEKSDHPPLLSEFSGPSFCPSELRAVHHDPAAAGFAVANEFAFFLDRNHSANWTD
jgi:hypothetical protein